MSLCVQVMAQFFLALLPLHAFSDGSEPLHGVQEHPGFHPG
jgi:hypothetical protein